MFSKIHDAENNATLSAIVASLLTAVWNEFFYIYEITNQEIFYEKEIPTNNTTRCSRYLIIL